MVFKKLKSYSEMVMFSHTLFSLPFTLSAMIIASGGIPELRIVFWIVMAFAGGRNGANALNRIIDRKIDGKNPRTSSRHLPSGELSLKEAYIITVVCFSVLTVSAWALNPLCFFLLPLAGAVFILYSFTKRFTYLCHLVLGAACAGGSLGAWIAVTGRIEFNALVLTAANALWVSGFDVIYGTQDIEFDRAEGLHSIPARFGLEKSLIISSVMHISSVSLLLVFGYLENMGYFYISGVIIIAFLLAAEHVIAKPGGSKRMKIASYSINQIIAVVFLVFTAADILI